MILLDSNVFVIDRFFRKDAAYPANRAFIQRMAEFDCAISIFTLLETAGVASFNLSPRECERWIHSFPTVYPVAILNAANMEGQSADEWLKMFSGHVASRIGKRMSLGDAILLCEAEGHDAESIVTWNTKDFARRASIPVHTPRSFLDQWGSR